MSVFRTCALPKVCTNSPVRIARRLYCIPPHGAPRIVWPERPVISPSEENLERSTSLVFASIIDLLKGIGARRGIRGGARRRNSPL
jgi:hypothetical protein